MTSSFVLAEPQVRIEPAPSKPRDRHAAPTPLRHPAGCVQLGSILAEKKATHCCVAQFQFDDFHRTCVLRRSRVNRSVSKLPGLAIENCEQIIIRVRYGDPPLVGHLSLRSSSSVPTILKNFRELSFEIARVEILESSTSEIRRKLEIQKILINQLQKGLD